MNHCRKQSRQGDSGIRWHSPCLQGLSGLPRENSTPSSGPQQSWVRAQRQGGHLCDYISPESGKHVHCIVFTHFFIYFFKHELCMPTRCLAPHQVWVYRQKYEVPPPSRSSYWWKDVVLNEAGQLGVLWVQQVLVHHWLLKSRTFFFRNVEKHLGWLSGFSLTIILILGNSYFFETLWGVAFLFIWIQCIICLCPSVCVLTA